MSVREELAERLEVDEQQPTEDEQRAALERRRQELAPEALAADTEAVAALEKVEADLAALDRRQQLAQLAATEQADRDRRSAEAEKEAQRQEWRAEQAAAESERDAALATFEKALPKALQAARTAIEANTVGSTLQGKIDPGSALGYRKLSREVESRLLRLVRDELGSFGIKPDSLVGREGMAPLVEVTPTCGVCQHEQREAIEATRADGASLRALEAGYGVSKSALSSHFRGHR